MPQLKVWVVIKQSPNLELKTWFLAWKNVKTHTLTTTTTGSNNLQKEISSQIDNQNQYSVSPKGLFFTGSWS